MRTVLSANDCKELFIEAQYPKCFVDAKNGFSEVSYSMDSSYSTGVRREIHFENVMICYTDVRFEKQITFAYERDMDAVKMLFALSGNSFTSDKDAGTDFTFNINQHNLLYADYFHADIAWASQQRHVMFEVNLLPSFFKKYCSDINPTIGAFLRKICDKKLDAIQEQNLVVTPAMYMAIRDILQCQRIGIFKRMYTEAKVIELLMLQLEQLVEPTLNSLQDFSEADIERVMHAKEILMGDTKKMVTLHELSRNVGTNEFVLKKGFKAIFGTTVFSYWNQMKMQEAKKLLADSNQNISEIAILLGYSNLQNFSNAFKRQFGVSPKYYREGNDWLEN